MSSKKSLNKQYPKEAVIINFVGREESDFQHCYTVIFKMSSFPQKNYKKYKETRKHGPHTGRGRGGATV